MKGKFGRRFVQNVTVSDRSQCLDAGGYDQRLLVVDAVVAGPLILFNVASSQTESEVQWRCATGEGERTDWQRGSGASVLDPSVTVST